MSTSKNIDRICIAVIAVTLILAILFMNGTSLGLTSETSNYRYENTLFNTDKVHTIDIVMNDWDSFIANCESEEYEACSVVIDGEKFSNIGIRAKGNTSLSNVKSMGSERYSLKLEFDHYDEGKTYYGLDKLCLNNLIQDNTMMKDYLAYTMMNSFGVDSPLCSYVYITVNNEDWGLYLAVESIEDSFLQREYGSDTGELYKPDSMSFGGGRGNGKDVRMSEFDFGGGNDGDSETTAQDQPNTFPGGDFPGGFQGGDSGGDMPKMPGGDFSGDMPEIPGSDSGDDRPEMPGGGGFGGFGMGSSDVKLQYIDDDPDSYSNIFSNAKTDVSESDQKRLINALKNLSEYNDLENTLDMDEVLRYFVVHNFVVNGDSYTGSMIHNYYLRENNGQLSMIPWDYNLAYGTFQGGSGSQSVNSDIDNPTSGDMSDRPMVGWIFSNDEYTEAYHELFEKFVEEWIDSGKLVQLIEDTNELIRPYVEKDPTKFCTMEEYEAGVNAITQFVTLRGQAVKNQLNGDYTAVDTEGLNTSDMGTMNTGSREHEGGPGNQSEESTDSRPEGSQATRPESGKRFRDSETDAVSSATPGTDSENTPDAVSSATVSKENNQGEQNNMPGGGSFTGQPPGMSTTSSQSQAWIWIGASALALIAGLVIAIKKRY